LYYKYRQVIGDTYERRVAGRKNKRTGIHNNDGGKGADPHLVHGISSIWNLDDFTKDNGATELIPYSHQWTNEVPGVDDRRRIITDPSTWKPYAAQMEQRVQALQTS
jgi:hypothetical protein